MIGGGDGGVARELGHYQEIEEIDVVEPDKVFVEVCKNFSRIMHVDLRIREYASFMKTD